MALILLVVFAILSRWIPHPPNMTMVGAVALFAGFYVTNKWLAALVPLVVLFVSDLVLGFHSQMVFVYGALLLTVVLGFSLRRWEASSGVSDKKWQKFLTWSVGALGSSILFFVISNLGVWLLDGLYPITMNGLVQCFVMAIPFFKTQWLGDLVSVFIIFGSYSWLSQGMLSFRETR